MWLPKKCVEYVLARDTSTNLPFSKKSDDMLPQVRRDKKSISSQGRHFVVSFQKSGREAFFQILLLRMDPQILFQCTTNLKHWKHRELLILSYSQQITRWMSRLESLLFRLTSGDPTQQWPTDWTFPKGHDFSTLWVVNKKHHSLRPLGPVVLSMEESG